MGGFLQAIRSSLFGKAKKAPAMLALPAPSDLDCTVDMSQHDLSPRAVARARISPRPPQTPQAESDGTTFIICAPHASSVFLAGSFNGWRTDTIPLRMNGSGSWTTELMLEEGRYEFRYIIDGTWCTDPATPFVPNPFGSTNNVLIVTPKGAVH